MQFPFTFIHSLKNTLYIPRSFNLVLFREYVLVLQGEKRPPEVPAAPPLSLLETPLKKETYKKLVKSRVINFWEKHLIGEASVLRESGFMPYFHPEYLSLLKPHRILTSAGK